MEIAIVLLLIFLHGFLVLGEIALVTAKRAKLEGEKSKGNRNAATAINLLDNVENYLSAMQIGITLISIIEGAYAGTAIARYLSPFISQIPSLASYADQLSLSIVIVIITYLSLVIGELAPKYIAIQYSEPLAIACAPAMKLITRILHPISVVLSWSTRLFMRMLFIKPNDNQNISEDEIKAMVKMANQQGVIEQKESEYIQNVFRFADRDAYDIMTHRNNVEWLDINGSKEENDKIIFESGYTKFLLCEDDLDHIIGVVKFKDYIQNREKPDFDLRNICTEPLFVPETMNSLKVLELFREKRIYFAVVVDEYGAPHGILTLHDLTENIFGTLPDLDDNEEPPIIHRTDGTMLVDGTIPIDELREAINLGEFDAEDADYSTLAGFIFYKLGEIPKSGDFFDVEGYRFEVMDMDRSKIDKVLISKNNALPPVRSE